MRKYPVIAVLIFILISIFYFFDSYNHLDEYKSIVSTNKTISENENIIGNLFSSSELIQKIEIDKYQTVNGIGLKFATYKRTNHGEMYVRIYSDKNVIYDNVVDLSSLKDNEFLYFDFQKQIELSKNSIVYISINFTSTQDNSIAIYTVRDFNIRNNLKINEDIKFEKLEYNFFQTNDLSIIKYIYVIIVIVIGIFIFFISNLLIKDKIKVENFAFFSIIITGIFSILIFTPYSIPDELYHIKTSYHAATKILDFTEEGNIFRYGDFNIDYRSSSKIDEYQYYINNFNIFMDEDLNKFTNNRTFQNITVNGFMEIKPIELIHYIQYFPQIIGILLSFICGFSFEFLLYISKFFSLFFYAYLIHLSIKIIPQNKISIFLISMLPMTIHLAGSFSYDAMIIPLGILLVSYIMYLNSKEYINIKSLLILLLLNILFLPNKIIVYFPVLLLNLVIFNKIKSRKISIIFYIILVFSSIFVFLIMNYNFLFDLINNVSNNVSQGVASNAYTLSYLLNNPIKTFIIFINTLKIMTPFYIQSMIGYSLGWFDVPLNNIIINIYITLMLLSSVLTLNEELIKNKYSELLLIFTFTSSSFLVVFSMFILWTPYGLDYIVGVQGRYFLPIILILLIFLSKIIPLKLKYDSKLFYILILVLTLLSLSDALNYII